MLNSVIFLARKIPFANVPFSNYSSLLLFFLIFFRVIDVGCYSLWHVNDDTISLVLVWEVKFRHVKSETLLTGCIFLILCKICTTWFHMVVCSAVYILTKFYVLALIAKFLFWHESMTHGHYLQMSL
jgi:hypothetical protein